MTIQRKTSSDSNLLEQLASEFAAEVRAGQQPSVEEYAKLNPAVAEKIRETFPMMAMMEMAQEARHTEDAADVLPGLEVNDYRILREVGRGGMGVVYEATQEKLGRSVALKVLPRRLAENPRSVERFYREARAAGQLNHDHIVPIYDVGSDRGLIYFTMRLIEGHSLAELLH